MRAPHPILIAALGIISGSILDGLVKGLAQDMDVLTITAWRFGFAAIYAGSIFIALRRPIPSAAAFRFHLMRAVIQIIAALTFFWSLTQLGLAEATVLGFTAALMIAPIARIILGEHMTGLSVGAAFIGFAGAALAISGETTGAPADGNRLLGVVSVMVAAVTYALTIVLLRLRTRQEDSITIVMFSNVLPATLLVTLIVGLNLFGVTGVQAIPQPGQFPILAAIGLFGMGIWWMFTLAYARAPAQQLAPIEYTALIWSALIGAVFFAEVPGWRLYAGAVIIIAACLIVAFESRFVSRKESGLPASDVLD
ncbi:MAG: DMT family transporter [Pseudomonadota bacterium]